MAWGAAALALAVVGCDTGGVQPRAAGGATSGGLASGLAGAASLGEGMQHLQAGQAGAAVATLRRALVREGRHPRLLNALAIAYAELGREAIGTRYFQEALRLVPGDAATLNNIGFAAMRRGELALARRYLAAAATAARTTDHGPTIAANLARLNTAEGTRALAALVRQQRLDGEGDEEIRVTRASDKVQRLATLPAAYVHQQVAHDLAPSANLVNFASLHDPWLPAASGTRL